MGGQAISLAMTGMCTPPDTTRAQEIGCDEDVLADIEADI